MFRKVLLYCGIAAPILYVTTVIVGAAIRTDYSHIVNAISELISNGAPNKAVLDVIFNFYNALLLAFAIGGYIVSKNAGRLCRVAMATTPPRTLCMVPAKVGADPSGSMGKKPQEKDRIWMPMKIPIATRHRRWAFFTAINPPMAKASSRAL